MSELTFDGAIDAFASDTGVAPLDALQWLLDHWGACGARCRAMLADYVAGRDMSERTERALFFIVHAAAEKADTAVFQDFCRLIEDGEAADLVMGDYHTVPSILISTFDGDTGPLLRLFESPNADEYHRGDALMALAYLTRTRRLTDSWMQATLAGLPERLVPVEQNFVWYGWVAAVAALGYGGLAAVAEDVMRRGLVDGDLMSPADFWQDLRMAQADPGGMSGPSWSAIGPLEDAVYEVSRSSGEEYASDEPPLAAPVVNPLRHVGRNDPCPCGSGRKFKKCCLGATAA